MGGERRRLVAWIAAAAAVLVTTCVLASTRATWRVAMANMVLVPAGEFTMGNDLGHDEQPAHRVYLDAFYIDRYEVTNAEYARFLNVIGGHESKCEGYKCADTKDDNPDSHIIYRAGQYAPEPRYEQHPVVQVSWYGAKAFCEHQGKRLPTEAEWEKAARGPDGLIYPWGNVFEAGKANAGHPTGDTTPVGSFPAGGSPYGAYDMAGNVWEWVADWYQPYPDSPARSDLFGQKYKVVRGGSWNHPAEDARTTVRDIAHPARRLRVVGFRCAR